MGNPKYAASQTSQEHWPAMGENHNTSDELNRNKAEKQTDASESGEQSHHDSNQPGQEHVKQPEHGRSGTDTESDDPAGDHGSRPSSDQADDQTNGSQIEPDNAEVSPSPSDSNEHEMSRLREALLRTRAEMDNLHKRTEREVEKSRKFAVESLLRDLVPVLDTLDQGIEAAGEAGSEGLSLTRKMLLDTLKRYGLEVVDPTGQSFDPQWHEAMSMVPSEDHDSEQVISVLQRGYRLHDRVVRAARVIVAK